MEKSDLDFEWAISDPHFFHKHVISYEKPRQQFTSLEDMHEQLIWYWNAFIKPNDRVHVLGDFSFAGVKETTRIISQLNGRKRLILGNHDFKYKPIKWIKMGFESAMYHDEVFIDGIRITMSHFPLPATWIQRTFLGYDDRYRMHKVPNEGQWHLHGHVHSKWQVKGKQINVGVDAWNMRPVHRDQILKIIKAA